MYKHLTMKYTLICKTYTIRMCLNDFSVHEQAKTIWKRDTKTSKINEIDPEINLKS